MSVKNQESSKRSAFSWFSEMRAIFSERGAATSFSCFVLFAEKRMKRVKETFAEKEPMGHGQELPNHQKYINNILH